jgi:hypothetical protein
MEFEKINMKQSVLKIDREISNELTVEKLKYEKFLEINY